MLSSFLRTVQGFSGTQYPHDRWLWSSPRFSMQFHWWQYSCSVLLSSPCSCSWLFFSSPIQALWCACSTSTEHSSTTTELSVHHQCHFPPLQKKKSIKPRAWIRPCGGHPGKACPWGSWDINTIYLGSWLSRNYFDWLQGHGKGLSNCFIWTLFMKDKRSRVTRGTCGFTSWKQHLPIDICEGSGPSGAVLQAKFKSAAASFVFQS